MRIQETNQILNESRILTRHHEQQSEDNSSSSRSLLGSLRGVVDRVPTFLRDGRVLGALAGAVVTTTAAMIANSRSRSRSNWSWR
jgi:hypothetical protein